MKLDPLRPDAPPEPISAATRVREPDLDPAPDRRAEGCLELRRGQRPPGPIGPPRGASREKDRIDTLIDPSPDPIMTTTGCDHPVLERRVPADLVDRRRDARHASSTRWPRALRAGRASVIAAFAHVIVPHMAAAITGLAALLTRAPSPSPCSTSGSPTCSIRLVHAQGEGTLRWTRRTPRPRPGRRS